jgi:hypothetical protein
MRLSVCTVRLLGLSVLFFLGSVGCNRSSGMDYAELVGRLLDLERLAELPAPGERAGQWSTYNRASRYDEAAGRYLEWDNNQDARGYIREEGESLVLAEMEGPGCIWRIWTARPGKGRMRIFIDNAPDPVIDMPFADYFDGKHEPFVFPSLVYEAATGYNAYVPIPYQESCRVVADKDWGAYLHVGYTTFPKNTRIPSYNPSVFESGRGSLSEVDRFFAERLGQDPKPERPGAETIREHVWVRPAEAASVATIDGPAAIRVLRVNLDESLSQVEWAAALREMTLRITWDGEDKPAVWTPLGDFFGTAPGYNLYTSLPMGMQRDGFYSYWFMPFAKSARIEIGNDGKRSYGLEVEIVRVPLQGGADRYGRFHAKWHRDVYLPEDPDRAIDWPMLITKGHGRFLGVNLHVWSPKGGWWGEGDEKIFIDGEKFPSIFGTGSEDYFGYAWGIPELFSRPFHSQTFNRADNRGHVSVNRWHVADDVPFQSGLEAYIEKYPRPQLGPPDDYACVSYWYLAPGGEDPYDPISLEERVGYYDYLVPSVTGDLLAFDSSTLLIDRAVGGKVSWKRRPSETRIKPPYQIDWQAARVGDRLVLRTLSLKKPGSYQVGLKLRGGPDAGILQFYLNGNKLGEEVDFRRPGNEDIDLPALGPKLGLQAGEQEILAQVVKVQGEAGNFGIIELRLTQTGAAARSGLP